MFKIEGVSSGWITGKISSGDITHEFDYSYLTDFLTDFMAALLSVREDMTVDTTHRKFMAECEPEIDKWELSVSEGILDINIKKYEDERAQTPDEEITLTFNYHDFIGEFLAETKRTIKRYGIVGYRQNWSFEFPVSLYLMLKSMISEKKLSIDSIAVGDNYGMKSVFSEFEEEIELLLS